MVYYCLKSRDIISSVISFPSNKLNIPSKGSRDVNQPKVSFNARSTPREFGMPNVIKAQSQMSLKSTVKTKRPNGLN